MHPTPHMPTPMHPTAHPPPPAIFAPFAVVDNLTSSTIFHHPSSGDGGE